MKRTVAMRKATAMAVVAAIAVSAACRGGDRDVGRGPDSTEDTESAQEPTPMFAVSAQAISSSFEVPSAIGTNVATGLSTGDRDLYEAQFQPGARVVDPIVPSLTPDVASFFGMFGAAGRLCERWPVDAVYVNVGGVLTAGSCDGLYRDLPDADQFPAKPRVVRHLPIRDGLATSLMHRIGLESAGTHPVETVVIIGFPESVGADLADQAATAEDFIDRLESAWATADPDALAQLYEEEATRHDGYSGDMQRREEIVKWYTLLFDTHPDLTLMITEGFASGLGPAATYDVTMTAGGDTCTMRLGAVWNLSDEGLISGEWVYYDPTTVLACGWASGTAP